MINNSEMWISLAETRSHSHLKSPLVSAVSGKPRVASIRFGIQFVPNHPWGLTEDWCWKYSVMPTRRCIGCPSHVLVTIFKAAIQVISGTFVSLLKTIRVCFQETCLLLQSERKTEISIPPGHLQFVGLRLAM